jgi:hypothetical protein
MMNRCANRTKQVRHGEGKNKWTNETYRKIGKKNKEQTDSNTDEMN